MIQGLSNPNVLFFVPLRSYAKKWFVTSRHMTHNLFGDTKIGPPVVLRTIMREKLTSSPVIVLEIKWVGSLASHEFKKCSMGFGLVCAWILNSFKKHSFRPTLSSFYSEKGPKVGPRAPSPCLSPNGPRKVVISAWVYGNFRARPRPLGPYRPVRIPQEKKVDQILGSSEGQFDHC